MPPVRQYTVMTHHMPATTAAWWRLLEALAAHVPPHWLAAAVQPLLQGQSSAIIRVRTVPRDGVNPTDVQIGTWPAAQPEPAETWDLGCLHAEAEASAALWRTRLPPALLAPGLVAADAAGAGGALVLVEIALGSNACLGAMLQSETGQAHKLGLVLTHPDAPKGLNFAELRHQRGSPARGGTRMQLLSCVWWVGPLATAPRGEGPAGMMGPRRRDTTAAQFWLREGRLQALQQGRWAASAVSMDTWQAATAPAAPLARATVVRKVAIASASLAVED